MSIGYDAVSSAASGLNASSLSWNHATGTLANGELLVGFIYYLRTVSASGVTYNGSAMTLVRRDNNGSASACSEVWRMENPPSGTHAIAITMTGGVGGGGNIAAGAITLSGVDQTTPVDAQAGDTVTGSHSSHSTNITTVANNAWIVDVVSWAVAGGVSGLAANGAQTQRVVQDGSPNTDSCGISTRAVATAGSTAMAWTFTSLSSATVHSLVSLKPAASGTSHVLGGTSSGVGATSGNAAANRALSGTPAGAAVATGALAARRALAGTSAGAAVSAGALSARRALAGVASGVGSAFGSFGALVWNLAGVAIGAATVTGAVTARRGLTGAATGTASATAGLSMRRALTGIASGIGCALASFGFVIARGKARISDRALYSATVSDGRAGRAIVSDAPTGGAAIHDV